MTPMMISLMVFLAVTGLVGLVAYAFRDRNTNAMTRLDMLVGKRSRDDKSIEILKKSARESDKQTILEAFTPKFMTPKKVFEQADCHLAPSTLFGLGLVLGVLGATMVLLFNRPWWSAPIVGLMLFMIPWFWLLNKRKKRLKKFASQLPDALELVARALRAGHSLTSGLQVVSDELPSPICDEFGRAVEEQNLGISVEDSLRSLTERVPNLDLRFFVTSVLIQRQTGGDLAEILDKIGYVIRERYRILGQVAALTGEGRLSGWVLIGLPFVLFILMIQMKPDYIRILWTDPVGIKMSVFAIVAQVVGALVIKKIVDIKV